MCKAFKTRLSTIKLEGNEIIKSELMELKLNWKARTEWSSNPIYSCIISVLQVIVTETVSQWSCNSEVDIENMTLEEYAIYELAMSTMKSEMRCDDITDYEDSDQEDGELPDLPTFSSTNEFASVCEQVEENIDVNTAQGFRGSSGGGR
nr:hypothetical protein [Tanacetum cinerariifolium]